MSGSEVFLTASIGAALLPDDSEGAEALLVNCDLALVRAKRAGGDQLPFFEAGMTSEARARLSFEMSLRQALSEEEFEILYQPIWSLDTGKVEALEALLRWRHPERGLLRPGEFLREAERLGLTAQIAPWVLRQACSHTKNWQEQFPGLKIAVNVDAQSFQRPDLMDSVLGTLEATGLSPSSLELELTESVAKREPEFGLTMLKQLRKARIAVALALAPAPIRGRIERRSQTPTGWGRSGQPAPSFHT